VSCYLRHMKDVFEALGLEYDKPNRKRVDAAVRQILSIPADEHCPEVWAAVKALPDDERTLLVGRIGESLAES